MFLKIMITFLMQIGTAIANKFGQNKNLKSRSKSSSFKLGPISWDSQSHEKFKDK